MCADRKPFAGRTFSHRASNQEIPVVTLDSSSVEGDPPPVSSKKNNPGQIIDSESDDDENDFQPQVGRNSNNYRSSTSSPTTGKLRKSSSFGSSSESEGGVGSAGNPNPRRRASSGQLRHKQSTPKTSSDVLKNLKPAAKAMQLAMNQRKNDSSTPAPKPPPRRKRAAPRKPQATHPPKDMQISHRPSTTSPLPSSPVPKRSRFSAALDSSQIVAAGKTAPSEAPSKSRPANGPLPLRSKPAASSSRPAPSVPPSNQTIKTVARNKKALFVNIADPSPNEPCYDRLKYFKVRPRSNPHNTLSSKHLAKVAPFAHAVSLLDGCTADMVCAVCGSGDDINFKCVKCKLSFHRGCLVPSTKKYNDTDPRVNNLCRACQPAPKGETIAEPSAETVSGKIRKLAADADKGNPIDFVLHPALYKQFVKGYKIDWLRCHKCKRLSEIIEGVLSESVTIPFECAAAYWEEDEEQKQCIEATKEKGGIDEELNIRISQRSKRRVRLMFSRFGEEHRHLFGYPKLTGVVDVDSVVVPTNVGKSPKETQPTPGTDENTNTNNANGIVNNNRNNNNKNLSVPAQLLSREANNPIERTMGALENALRGNNAPGVIVTPPPDIAGQAPSTNVTDARAELSSRPLNAAHVVRNQVNAPRITPPVNVATSSVGGAGAPLVGANRTYGGYVAPVQQQQPAMRVGNGPISASEMVLSARVAPAQPHPARSAPPQQPRPSSTLGTIGLVPPTPQAGASSAAQVWTAGAPVNNNEPKNVERVSEIDYKVATENILSGIKSMNMSSHLEDILIDMTMAEHSTLFLFYKSLWNPQYGANHLFNRRAIRLAEEELAKQQGKTNNNNININARAQQAPPTREKNRHVGKTTINGSQRAHETILNGQTILCRNGRQLTPGERNDLCLKFKHTRLGHFQEELKMLQQMFSEMSQCPVEQVPSIHRLHAIMKWQKTDQFNREIRELIKSIPGVQLVDLRHQQNLMRQAQVQQAQAQAQGINNMNNIATNNNNINNSNLHVAAQLGQQRVNGNHFPLRQQANGNHQFNR